MRPSPSGASLSTRTPTSIDVVKTRLTDADSTTMSPSLIGARKLIASTAVAVVVTMLVVGLLFGDMDWLWAGIAAVLIVAATVGGTLFRRRYIDPPRRTTT